MADLKPVYKAETVKAAEIALDALEEKWGTKYPIVIKSWRKKWPNLSVYFKYPADIRRVIYTTNAIEAVHRQFRKLTKTKGAFPNENSLLKLLYMCPECAATGVRSASPTTGSATTGSNGLQSGPCARTQDTKGQKCPRSGTRSIFRHQRLSSNPSTRTARSPRVPIPPRLAQASFPPVTASQIALQRFPPANRPSSPSST